MHLMKRVGLVLAASVVTLLGLTAPAHAADGPTGYSGCIKTSSADTLRTYATAKTRATKVSAVTNRVVLNVYGTGRTYDCGQHGNTRTAPSIAVTVTYTVTGSSVNCSIGGGIDGSISLSCSGTSSQVTITESYTCRNVSWCEISDSNATFTAVGRIDSVDVNTKVSISGPNGPASANSWVRAYQR